MKTRVLLFFIAMLGLSACQWGEPKIQTADINLDTLAFKYDTIKQRAVNCGNKPDSTCTVASIIYPQFTGQKVLNDTVSQKLINLFGLNNPDKKPDTSLHTMAVNFIKNYENDKAHMYAEDMFYTLDLKAEVVRQDSSLTTLQVEGYNFRGGAHGASFTSFINWNTKSQNNIGLKEIFNDGYDHKLTAIADTIFRQQEKLTQTATLAGNYFFKDDKFALPQTFLITPVGLKFLYNQYEIKPYAAGQTELNIPYTKIKTLLRANTVVTQYLK